MIPKKTAQAPARKGILYALAIALVPALVKLLCYPGNIGSDDAYIHLRIATNFISGLGWGINPHQPVNLSTSPAFTLILAAAELATRHGIGLVQLLSGSAVIAGLLLIFLTALAETRSLNAALIAELAASFSVNLWRWNGALMEASFAFAVVALTLYLCRENASSRPLRIFLAGLVLGIGMLLRPEMGIVLVLALFVQWVRSAPADKLRNSILILAGTALILVPWCVFARHEFGAIIPTTFAAKAGQHLRLVNLVILRQFGESVVESILFPTVMILFLLLTVRRSEASDSNRSRLLRYVIPAGWVIGLVSFYYLKTASLQSVGRYVLPLLPGEVMVLGLLWAGLESRLRQWQKWLAVALMALHAIFAVGLNYRVVMPVLRRFEGEYGATMRAAADELAKDTRGNANRRVLVMVDIGVLSCAGNGRFEIFDGGSLATPSLRGLSLRDKIQKVQPAYVVQSLATDPDGFGADYSDELAPIWRRRFLQFSMSNSNPYYYTIIYQAKNPSPGSAAAPVTTR